MVPGIFSRSIEMRQAPALGSDARNLQQDHSGLPGTVPGSHMPLDTGIHWQWSNPLNVIPLLIVVCVVVALVALIA